MISLSIDMRKGRLPVLEHQKTMNLINQRVKQSGLGRASLNNLHTHHGVHLKNNMIEIHLPSHLDSHLQ